VHSDTQWCLITPRVVGVLAAYNEQSFGAARHSCWKPLQVMGPPIKTLTARVNQLEAAQGTPQQKAATAQFDSQGSSPIDVASRRADKQPAHHVKSPFDASSVIAADSEPSSTGSSPAQDSIKSPIDDAQQNSKRSASMLPPADGARSSAAVSASHQPGRDEDAGQHSPVLTDGAGGAQPGRPGRVNAMMRSTPAHTQQRRRRRQGRREWWHHGQSSASCRVACKQTDRQRTSPQSVLCVL
jgi:hypothetical protein